MCYFGSDAESKPQSYSSQNNETNVVEFKYRVVENRNTRIQVPQNKTCDVLCNIPSVDSSDVVCSILTL